MIRNKAHLSGMAMKALLSAAGCIILGLVFLGTRVLDPTSPLFGFVVFGVVGGVSFALFDERKYRDAAYVLLLLYLILFLTQSTEIAIVYLIYFVVVVTGTFLFVHFFFFRIDSLPIARPFVFAAILAIGVAFGTAVQWLIFARSDGTSFSIWRNIPLGFMIGLGLGLGVELAEYLRKERHRGHPGGNDSTEAMP